MHTTPPLAMSSVSAETIGGNDDILTEILTHLPIQPLFRFKSVSKHFRSLISDPSFALLHTLRHPNPPPSALFLPLPLSCSSSSSPSFSLLPLYPPSPLPSPPSLHPCSLIQSCNGILLFVLSTGKGVGFVVVNPTTWAVFVVPNSRLVSDPNTHISIGQGQVDVSNPGKGHGQGQVVVSNLGEGHGQGQGQIVVSNSTSHIPDGQGQIVVSNTGQGHVVASNPIITKIPTVHEHRQVLLSDPTTHFPIVHGQGVFLDSSHSTTHVPIVHGQGQEVVLDSTTHVPIVRGQGHEQEVLSDPTIHVPVLHGHGEWQEHGEVVLSDSTTGVPIVHGHEHGDVVLSDPTIFFDDTQPAFEKEDNELVGLNLAFDPARWAHYYLIRVFKHFLDDGDDGDDRFSIVVYSSDVRVWRDRVVWFDNAPFDVEFRRGVYWKGRVFWLSHTGSTVYYDVDNEVVGRLFLPKVFDEETYLERFRYFGECCGHLHLIEIRTNCVREFDVLELEENGEGLEWVVKFKVDLDVVGCGFEDDMFQDGVDRFGRRIRFYALSILAVIRDNGDGANDALVLSIPSKVISYSFKSRVSRLLCNVVDESDKWFPFRGYNAFQFIESLYRP